MPQQDQISRSDRASPQKASRPPHIGPNYKTAAELDLATGHAIKNGGVITRLPADHQLASDGFRRTPIQAAPPRVEVPAPHVEANVGNVNINTSALDRAKAFITSTAPVSMVTMIIALLIRLYWMRLPFWQLDTLYVALTGYAVSWIINWMLYHVGSPEIRMIWNATMQNFLSYKIITQHQKDRQQRRNYEQYHD